jgi:hypothetical protein
MIKEFASSATCIHVRFLLGLFFDTSDGDDMFLQTADFQRTTRHDIPEERTLSLPLL